MSSFYKKEGTLFTHKRRKNSKKTMSKFLGIVSLVAVMVLAVACGGQTEHKFVGKFTDEFGNKFELREDHTALIQFDGMESPVETRWTEGHGKDSLCVSIEYNMDPSYYFLKDGVLYRHRKDMEQGHPAISIEYE